MAFGKKVAEREDRYAKNPGRMLIVAVVFRNGRIVCRVLRVAEGFKYIKERKELIEQNKSLNKICR